MSVIFNIIIIIVCIYYTHTQDERRRGQTLPFPHLIDFNESDIGKPYNIFEGVDYQQIPQKLYDVEFKNCYTEYTRCIRLTLYANPVCGYHTYQNRLYKYHSICELDLAGCNEMQRKKIDMFGTTYRQRGVYFMGEGDKCEIYVRRIAEGLTPRDIRDSPQDVFKPITNMKTKNNVIPTAKDLQHDETIPDYMTNIEYDYDNVM